MVSLRFYSRCLGGICLAVLVALVSLVFYSHCTNRRTRPKTQKNAMSLKPGGGIGVYPYVYIYIYILDSHMAPYGACEVAQNTARSNAQIEAERFRKLEQWFRALSGLEGKTSMLEQWFRAKKWLQSTLEQWFRALSGLKACSSRDFERKVVFSSVLSNRFCVFEFFHFKLLRKDIH